MVKMELPHVSVLTKMDICPDRVWGRLNACDAKNRKGIDENAPCQPFLCHELPHVLSSK